MPQQRRLRSRQHKIQGMSAAEQATLIQATLNNFPRQTRATARVIKQNAMEAGLIQPEMKPTPRKPVRVTRIVSIGSEDSDSELEFTFESDRKAMNPWRQVSQSESARAWKAWEAEQDSLDQLLRNPNYNVGSARPPRPILMKDLASSTDTYGIDSPVTFEPDLRQWRAFEVLISHLQEYANGREDGFVKVKVPEGALIPVVGATHFVKEVPTINHRIRLDRLPKHNNCVTKGIYCVKLSSNHYQDSTLTWRAILDDYDSECRKDVMVASDAKKNERLETLAKIHHQRQEQDAARRKGEDDPVGSIAQRVRDAEIGPRRLLSNSGSTQINPPSNSRDTTISRDQIGTDGGSSNPHSSSTPSKEPTDSEDATVFDGRSESDDQSADSHNTRTKASPEPVPPFTEDVMLSLPGRHESMIYSPNNTANPTLRIKLNLPTIDLPSSLPLDSSTLHLAGNAGIAIPLSSPLPINHKYQLFHNHRGAPIHFTVIAPLAVRTLVQKIHAASYTWGAGFTRPRKPPVVAGALGGEQKLYVCKERLQEWGVAFREVVLGVGECLVLLPGVVVQGFWEECGVLEVVGGGE